MYKNYFMLVGILDEIFFSSIMLKCGKENYVIEGKLPKGLKINSKIAVKGHLEKAGFNIILVADRYITLGEEE